MEKEREAFFAALKKVDPASKAGRELAREVTKYDRGALQFASNELKKDPEVVRAAVMSRPDGCADAIPLGVEVYTGKLLGNGRDQIAIIQSDGAVSLFDWDPLTPPIF